MLVVDSGPRASREVGAVVLNVASSASLVLDGLESRVVRVISDETILG